LDFHFQQLRRAELKRAAITQSVDLLEVSSLPFGGGGGGGCGGGGQ